MQYESERIEYKSQMIDDIPVFATGEAMVVVICHQHTGVAIIVEGAASHSVSANIQAEVFRCHPWCDRGFDSFKNCHRHFSFQFF